jgi:hypothetical protein
MKLDVVVGRLLGKRLESLVLELPAEDTGEILLLTALLVNVLTVEGAFFTKEVEVMRIGGPIMLDPLELDRLAEIRDVAGSLVEVDDPKALEGICCWNLLGSCVFNGIFLTVFVEIALFKDVLELPKLVFELLRSTSSRLLATNLLGAF